MIIRGKDYTAEEIIEGIGDCHYVSFDIFDTLVKRCVATPSDIFCLVARDYARKYNNNLDEEEFRKLRIIAAKYAQVKVNKEGKEEKTLADIYSELRWKFDSDYEELMQLEINKEIACCKQNPEMKKVYDWCLAQGKVIFITSDMYLPLSAIEQILHKCGFTVYDELYLSSEEGKRKQSGSLYCRIIEGSHIKRQDFVHIGDHFKSDYLQARRFGLKAIKIPRDMDRCQYRRKGLFAHRDEQYDKLQTIIGNFSQRAWPPYRQYGFECIGPMLYGFCTWLHRRSKEEGRKKLFFLSRDGYMMQQAYQELFGKESLPNTYMYASRKSLFGPQVWMNPDLKDILKQETPYHYWDVDELCEMLDVEKFYGRKVWENCGLSQEERILKNELFTDKRVRNFFETVLPQMIEASKAKFDNVISYLKQEGFEGSVGIVDVGWAGAIQRYLYRFVEKAGMDTNIYGFYLGLKPVTVTGPQADAYIPQSERPSLFCSNLMEYPFTKLEGSTKGYRKRNDGQVEPLLADYEFEDMEDKVYTHDMQEGALQFIELMASGYGVMDVDWHIGYRNIRNATKSPRLSDVKLLGGLSHVNHGRRAFLARSCGLGTYLCHPKQLKMDFLGSGWKIGFLKQLLKLPLPYDYMLKLIRKD